jgi:hypothetical protein
LPDLPRIQSDWLPADRRNSWWKALSRLLHPIGPTLGAGARAFVVRPPVFAPGFRAMVIWSA